MPSSRGSSRGSSDPRSRSPKSWRAKGGKRWEDDTFKYAVESWGGSSRGSSVRGGEKSGKDTLGWISRTVCGFGRYPDKRPKGLHADGAGAFSVRNLMQVWGEQHSLSESQIVKAIQQNMFHERKGGSSGAPELRFALDQATNGDMRIRVNPSRQKGQSSRPIATPFRGERRGRSFDDGFSGQEDVLDRGHRGRGGNSFRKNSRNSSANGRKHWEREHRPSPKWRDPWVGNSDPWASSRPSPPQGLDKVPLPMPLDEPVQAGGACLHVDCPLRAHSTGGHGGFCCQRCQWAHGSGEPPEHGRKCESVVAEEKLDVDMDGDADVCPVKIVNWVEWVLETGYIECDVCKEDQWLSVNDLLTKLQDRQPNFGVRSVNQLRQAFADYVTEYEFTEDNEWLRKVDSEERRDPPSKSPSPFAPHASVQAEPPVMEPPVMEPPVMEPPTSIPVLTKGLKAEPRDEKMEVPRPPPPPPGESWCKYSDGPAYWWYYNGPCGEWWCPDDGKNEVRRYSAEMMAADRH